MADIAPIRGLIELQDDFTSRLGLAEAALSNFTKENQESLMAVAGVAGILTAALGATAVAVYELGQRGSAVNDLKGTMVEFAGSAELAEDMLRGLREGTRGTVADFTLAENAAHLLSTGVKLTAEQFKTLGEASFVLADRGLGTTKENLDLVSDALATGRTRALAMKLGVIENIKAEEDFAKALGITVGNLSDSGKAEARRIEVMRLLNEATKSGAGIQADFGDRVESTKAFIQNQIDALASAVDSSAVFAAGMDAVGKAVSAAFGDDQDKAIKNIVGAIESLAIKIFDVAQVGIMAARVFNGAWNAVRTAVLGVTTVVTGLLTGVVAAVGLVAQAAEKLNIISPEAAQGVIDMRENLHAMTVSLAEQTVEASKGVFGHTEFDKTLDGLSETISNVRNAMQAAKDQTAENTAETEKADEGVKAITESNNALTSSYVNQVKVQQELQKSTKELSVIWADHYAMVVRNSSTTAQAQQADIEAVFQRSVAALNDLDPLYKQKYAAYEAIAKESLNAISMSWDSVKDQSLEALEAQRDAAERTYEAMLFSSLTFSREALDTQRQKWWDLKEAVMDYGNGARQSVGEVTDEMKELTDATDAAYEAAQRLKQTFSFDVTSQNFGQTAQSFGLNSSEATDLAKKGYSFAEIVAIMNNTRNGLTGPLPPPQGPRIPGFAEGGLVMVGERGPEAVRLPFGSAVYPNGTMPKSDGVTLNVAPGAFVFNYPFMNDPRAKAEMGKMIGDVLIDRAKGLGKRF